MAELKVMTFNLRVEASIDGINHLDNRKGRILETVNNEKPDLIGFQEAADDTRAWLRDNLADYVVLGCGREADLKGESTPIAFRKDRFEAISYENFALSSTPHLMGTRFVGVGQSDNSRMATSVVLKHEGADMPILFVNTHTDHHAPLTRQLSFSQLIRYLSDKALPCILTGDLNTLPDSPEVKILTENKSFPLTDATAEIKSTFHAFGRLATNEYYKNKFGDRDIKLDYVFTNMKTCVSKSYAVEDSGEDGIYISDHRPVVAFVEI